MEEDIFFRTAAELLKLNSEKKAALKRLGIENIRDLLFYAPLSYRKKKIDPDLSDLVEGDLISAKVKIDSLDFPKRRGSPVKVAVSNSTGSILLIFFNRIPKFILPRLKIGNIVRVAGKVRREGYYFQIAHPEFLFGSDEADSETEPLYGLTYGLLNKSLRSYIWKAFEKIENSGSRSFVVPIIENLKGLHLIGAAGEDPTRIMEEARKNLAAEELKAYRLSLDLVRKGRGLKKGIVFKKNEKFVMLPSQ